MLTVAAGALPAWNLLANRNAASCDGRHAAFLVMVHAGLHSLEMCIISISQFLTASMTLTSSSPSLLKTHSRFALDRYFRKLLAVRTIVDDYLLCLLTHTTLPPSFIILPNCSLINYTAGPCLPLPSLSSSLGCPPG